LRQCCGSDIPFWWYSHCPEEQQNLKVAHKLTRAAAYHDVAHPQPTTNNPLPANTHRAQEQQAIALLTDTYKQSRQGRTLLLQRHLASTPSVTNNKYGQL
jgi:hypothetical protein